MMMRDLTGYHRGYSYIYDDENRLVAIRKSGGTLSVAAFEYDALGRRIEKVDAIAGTTTRYYYDDQRVLLETDATGTEFDIRCFVYGNYIDEVLVMVDLDGGNGVPDGDYYYGHDHLYSVHALFDAGGLVAERYYYDAYGKTRIYNSDYSASQATSRYGNPYTFTGRRLDTLDGGSLNLMYYRARTYDPQTGRFMQRDPLGINPAGGNGNPFKPSIQYINGIKNMYEYVESYPLGNIDPSGLEWIDVNYWYDVPSTKTMEGVCLKYNKYLEWEEKKSGNARLNSKYVWDYSAFGPFKCKVEFDDWTFDTFRYKGKILGYKQKKHYFKFWKFGKCYCEYSLDMESVKAHGTKKHKKETVIFKLTKESCEALNGKNESRPFDPFNPW